MPTPPPKRLTSIKMALALGANVFCGVLLLLAACTRGMPGAPLWKVVEAAPKSTAPAKVRVDFYGEGLCPDCAAFTTRISGKAFDDGLSEIMEYNFIGWGNAKNVSGKVECQHGPMECELNRALNCAQHHSQSQDEFFRFLYCVEELAFQNDREFLQTCSSRSHLDYTAIDSCTNGDLGYRLEREAARATPKHNFVPWVVVNGVPLAADCGNLATYVCAAYQGARPAVCFEPQDFQACPGAPTKAKGMFNQLVLGTSR